MLSQLRSLSIACLVISYLLALPAHARATGITGRSGKQGATCSGCHTPTGSAPTVQLNGPSRLEPGATGDYSLTLTGGPGSSGGFGGMNVAVDSAEAYLEPGSGLFRQNEELTHAAPRSFSGTSVVFNFALTAPSTSGLVKLYAAGNSVNGDSNNTGDRSALTTLTIAVGDVELPDAGTPDGGTDNPDAGSGTPDAGTGNPNPSPGNGGDEPKDDGGCTTAGGQPMGVLLLCLVARAWRRRQSGTHS